MSKNSEINKIWLKSFHLCDNVSISVEVKFLFSKFNFLASKFRKHDCISDLDADWDNFSEVVELSWSCFEDDSVYLSVGLIDDDAWGGFGLGFDFSDDDSVEEGDDSLEWGHADDLIEVDRFIILVLIKTANKLSTLIVF